MKAERRGKKPMPWFRFYTETTRDTKLRTLPKDYRWLWPVMETIARNSPEPGRLLIAPGIPADAAAIADEAGPGYTSKDVIRALPLFEARRMVHFDSETIVLSNWHKRQFSTDNTTARVEEWREKQKQCNVALNGQCNVGTTVESIGESNVIPSVRTELQSTEYRVSGNPVDPQEDERPVVISVSAPSAPKRPRKPSSDDPGYSPEFEHWWALYPASPNKTGKPRAWTAWRKWIGVKAPRDPGPVIDATRHLAEYVEIGGRDAEHLWNPANFLTGGHYEQFVGGAPEFRPVPKSPNGRPQRESAYAQIDRIASGGGRF